MKNKLLVFVLILSSVISFAQTKLYIHSNADHYVENTKTIAILPLDVNIKLRPRQLKKISTEEVEKMEKESSISIQKAMHTWFLTRKKRGKFEPKVQTPARTNALLKKHGIDIHSYSDNLMSDLGKILGVDVVVTGSYETTSPMSNGAALGLGLALGVGFTTNTATMNMDFISTVDDEVVVNYYKKLRSGFGSDSQDLINILMRKVSRRIPYTK